MAVPLFLSAQYSGTAFSIYFNRAIQATLGSELVGFTFELNGSPIVPVFSAIVQNALAVTLPGAPLITDVLTVRYNGLGTITDAATGLDSATAFLAQTATLRASPAIAYVASVTVANNVIAIAFNEPVASVNGNLVTGWLASINSVPISMLAVTGSLSADLRTLSLTFPNNFAYVDDVDIAYTPGGLYSWPTGVVAAFSLTNIFNRSTNGLPTSQYPLSYVSKYQVIPQSGVAKPKLGVSLNPVDIRVVSEYGPAQVTTGGIFGITVTNPAGISVGGKLVDVVDGAEITQTFMGSYSAADIVAAAQNWQAQVIVRISVALGTARAADQSVTPATTVIVQV